MQTTYNANLIISKLITTDSEHILLLVPKHLFKKLVNPIYQRTKYYLTIFTGYHIAVAYFAFLWPPDLVIRTVQASDYNKTYSHGYTYDGYGRIETLTYPSGLQVRYGYTPQGYLNSVSDVASGAALRVYTEVDAYGHIQREEYGNGLQTQRVYDAQTGRLQSIETRLGSVALQDNTYSWRGNGILESRIHREDGNTLVESFQYDALNRLKAARTFLGDEPRRALEYDYSRLGNILTKTSDVVGDLSATGYRYGGTVNAGPHAVSEVALGTTAYQLDYDLNGNVTQYESSGGDDKYIDWNARNLPVAITVGDPDTAALRKSRIGDSLIHIQTLSHAGVEEESMEYLHRDHLGSVEAVTDASGNRLYTLAYDPFGGRRNSDWSSDIDAIETDELLEDLGLAVSRDYTGHEHLDRTGFIHMNGRVYDPQLGRFLSPDPLVQSPAHSQSWNRYSYVFNSPLSYTDPTGYLCGYYDEGPGDCGGGFDWSWGWSGWGAERSIHDYDWRAELRREAKLRHAERLREEGRFNNRVRRILSRTGVESPFDNPTGGIQVASATDTVLPIAIAISQLDSPAPGPADLIAVGVFGAAMVIDGMTPPGGGANSIGGAGETTSPGGFDPNDPNNRDPFGNKLKAQLRLKQRLAQGNIRTSGGSLEVGSANRAAVFDVRTRTLYVGQTNHIGVVTSYGLPLQAGRYVGGFARVARDGTIRFTHGSGSFPGNQVSNAVTQNVDDLIRGIGVRVSNPL